MYEILIVDDSVLDIDCILFLIDKYKTSPPCHHGSQWPGGAPAAAGRGETF